MGQFAIELDRRDGDSFPFQLLVDGIPVESNEDCVDPEAPTQTPTAAPTFPTASPTSFPTRAPTPFPTPFPDSDDDDDRRTRKQGRKRALQDLSRCSCGDNLLVTNVLTCTEPNGNRESCEDSLFAKVTFKVSQFFVNEVEQGNQRIDGENGGFLVAFLNILASVILLIMFVIWWSRRNRAKKKLQEETDGDGITTVTASIFNLEKADLAPKPGRQNRRANRFIVFPGMFGSQRSEDTKTVALSSVAQANTDRMSQITRESLRSNFLQFHRSTNASALSAFLRSRFSLSNLSGPNPFSVSNQGPESVAGESGISSFEVQSYKTGMSTLEQERYKKLRTESVRLSENIARLSILLGFGETGKQARRQSVKWHRTARELVKNVCEKLHGEILTAREVEFLKAPGKLGELVNKYEEVPEIALERYLYRLVTGLNRWFYDDPNVEIAGIRSLLICLIYLVKIKQLEQHFVLTVYIVHRLFGVMMLVAAKFSEDEPISNAYWAEIAGMEMEELNELEEAFCFSSGFNFFVTPSELAKMYQEYGLDFLIIATRVSVKTDGTSSAIVPQTPVTILGQEYSL